MPTEYKSGEEALEDAAGFLKIHPQDFKKREVMTLFEVDQKWLEVYDLPNTKPEPNKELKDIIAVGIGYYREGYTINGRQSMYGAWLIDSKGKLKQL